MLLLIDLLNQQQVGRIKMATSIYPSTQISTQTSNFSTHNWEVILVATTTLLVVISFVLSLHICAKWLFISSPQRASPPPISNVHSQFSINGLDDSTVAALPIFMYRSDSHKSAMECVVCLTVFEEGDQVKLLPKCEHGFHVKCIDRWLLSHSTCPVCRADHASTSLAIEVSNHDPLWNTDDSGMVDALVDDT